MIVGSGETVVTELERWRDEAGVDGFNIDYALREPDLQAFGRYVSPVLRRRGLLTEGSGTLRSQLMGTDLLPDSHPAAGFRR